MKLELIQIGDHRGVGCIVKQTNIFGSTTNWTVKLKDADTVFKKWICLENGKAKFASADGEYLENFYVANFGTKNKPGEYRFPNQIETERDIPETLILRGEVK